MKKNINPLELASAADIVTTSQRLLERLAHVPMVIQCIENRDIEMFQFQLTGQELKFVFDALVDTNNRAVREYGPALCQVRTQSGQA